MKSESINSYVEIKQPTSRDTRQLGVMVSDTYEADSTDQQTVINLTFAIDINYKKQIDVFIDGRLLTEGATGNFTWTNMQNGVSNQITLNTAIIAGLPIKVKKLGAYQEQLPNPSSVTANINNLSTALDYKGNTNAMINGCFDFWQRGTTFTAIANAAYFADKWKHEKVGSTVATITRDTDVPSSAFGIYSANLTVTTASGTPAAGDKVILEQFVEGNIFRKLKGKNIVHRFWVKSPKTGIHCISYSNSGGTKCLIKEYTIAVANTWQQITIRFNHDSTGTWLYDTNIGMGVQWALVAGTTFQAAKDVWQTSNVYATSNQVNCCDTIGNVFKIADSVMCEDNISLNALPGFVYSGRDFRDELTLCQRYYEKSYNINVNPGTITSVGQYTFNGLGALARPMFYIPYKVQKRVTIDSVTFYSDATGAIGNYRNLNLSTDAAISSPTGNSGESVFSAQVADTPGLGSALSVHWTADCDF